MLGVGEELKDFNVVGVKPKYNSHEENGESAFEEINKESFPNKWKVIYFYPKDFTFICPTEITQMDKLVDEAIVVGISGDNEYSKLNWKKFNNTLTNIKHTLGADSGLYLASECGILNIDEGVANRATFIVNPEGEIQHVSVTAMDTGRSADEILRTLQALKAGGLTGCGWEPGDQYVA